MGSLMAGWNSPVFSSKQASLERKTSFTKEEIDNYWKSKRDLQEEHLRAAAEAAMQLKAEERPNTNAESKIDQAPASELTSVEDELEKVSNYRDWWTKSSWAFLNEPALRRLEGNDTYAAQYHVAALATSSADN